MLAIILSVFVHQMGSSVSPNIDVTHFDCGAMSLCILERLEGREPDLGLLQAELTAHPGIGSTIQELVHLSRAMGRPMEGRRFRYPVPIDRPIIAHLSEGEHGHFVVIRPVGTSRRLVQIIDPSADRPPRIMTLQDLVLLPGWTGYIVVPVRDDRLKTAGIALLIVLAAAGVTEAFRRVMRSTRVQHTPRNDAGRAKAPTF